jgi:hypothetical protein
MNAQAAIHHCQSKTGRNGALGLAERLHARAVEVRIEGLP